MLQQSSFSSVDSSQALLDLSSVLLHASHDLKPYVLPIESLLCHMGATVMPNDVEQDCFHHSALDILGGERSTRDANIVSLRETAAQWRDAWGLGNFQEYDTLTVMGAPTTGPHILAYVAALRDRFPAGIVLPMSSWMPSCIFRL